MNALNKFNQKYFDWAIDYLCNKHKLEEETVGVYSMNMGKKTGYIPIFRVEDNYMLYAQDNLPTGIKLETGPFSAFDVLCNYECKGNIGHALTEVLIKMKETSSYIRVAGDYFKIIYRDAGGFEKEEVLPWPKTEIKQDMGKNFMEVIKAYDGFTLEPMNIGYKRNYKSLYNSYAPIPHMPVPCDDQNKIPWSMRLIKHIFQDKWELGLKYMQCMFLHPKQMLPIPCLVSSENQTGKSTFLNWNIDIYGANATILGVADLRGQFNSHYANKLLIGVEETKSNEIEVLNRIKQLSTARQISVNAKGIKQYDQNFYGKFIFTSNHKTTFLKIEQDDIRYWVLEVPQITHENHSIENDLRKEIPQFLGYLMSLPPIEFGKSRQVFTDEEIGTDLKEAVKGMSHSHLYLDIRQLFIDYFNSNPAHKEISFTLGDLWRELLEQPGFNKNKYSKGDVKLVLIEEMKLNLSRPKQYERVWGIEQSILNTNGRGYNPHYTIRRNTFKDADWRDALVMDSDQLVDSFYDDKDPF